MGEQQPAVTIADALLRATFTLRRAGLEEARREAASLLAHIVGRNRAFLITHADEEVSAADFERFQQAIARRARGEPQQYITGRQEFYGLDFEVNADVLIPRPETELLVETALEVLSETPSPRICDVGTGSGCVAIALLHERADARALAIDISRSALEVAARNAARHHVVERLELLVSDCFDELEGDGGAERFQLIVSNPPYVAERDLSGLQREVREHEPRIALTPGGDGLSVIRRLLTEAPGRLSAGGHLLFEIGFNQHEAVHQLIDPHAWTLLDIHRDLQGIPRTVALKLNE